MEKCSLLGEGVATRRAPSAYNTARSKARWREHADEQGWSLSHFAKWQDNASPSPLARLSRDLLSLRGGRRRKEGEGALSDLKSHGQNMRLPSKLRLSRFESTVPIAHNAEDAREGLRAEDEG